MGDVYKFQSEAYRRNRNESEFSDNNNPLDNPTIKPMSDEQSSFLNKHIKQYTEFISWAR